jgi:pro-apoptotic serine protease NMA111
MESPPKEEAGGELAMEIESSVTADDWRRALSLVVPSVVVIRTTAPRAFDTEVAGASYATGFVVDKSRGIILTNRHVVKPGNRGCLPRWSWRLYLVYFRVICECFRVFDVMAVRS